MYATQNSYKNIFLISTSYEIKGQKDSEFERFHPNWVLPSVMMSYHLRLLIESNVFFETSFAFSWYLRFSFLSWRAFVTWWSCIISCHALLSTINAFLCIANCFLNNITLIHNSFWSQRGHKLVFQRNCHVLCVTILAQLQFQQIEIRNHGTCSIMGFVLKQIAY